MYLNLGIKFRYYIIIIIINLKSHLNIDFNLDLYISIGLLLVLAALFTIGGGASAVIWTDFIQTIFMILGAFILMIISIILL